MRDYLGFLTLMILTSLAFLLVWFGLRSYGLSKPVSEYQTPLVKTLAQQSASAPLIFSNNKNDHLTLLNINFIKGEWVNENNSQPLALILESLKAQAQPFLLYFSGPSAQALPKLRKLFADPLLWKHTLFCSRFDGLLKDLRELEPRWSYCSGEIFMTRLLSLSSLGLASLLTISADVLFVHLSTNLSTTDIDHLIAEGHRQNKLVMVGPVPRPMDGVRPNGWMVESGDQKVQ